ncbi:MAG: signal peptide peptidase SppA [Acidobacteriales bacterium]|nr:MAG: signal peptide peptidase SppA [Terriglobales bacterium]
MNLEGEIPEQAPFAIPLPFFQARAPLPVSDVWRLLRRAETDDRIKAVVLMPAGIDAGWAKLQELHADLARLVKSGKPVVAYLRTPSVREYYLATAASRIYMPPEDMLDLKGLRAELNYFRGTLDKLGVQVDIEHAGKYKDYGDMFTRTSMSPETAEVLNSILDEVYGHLIETVAAGRKKQAVEVRAVIDEGPFLARQALSKGLVDALLYEDQVFGDLEKKAGVGRLERLSARNYLRATSPDEESRAEHRIALVVGEGAIAGRQGGGLDADTGLNAPSFIRLLRQIGDDTTIRAVIVRVNSPGGESFASDEIWREMSNLSRKKPMVVSMSDEAASGGYYISMTGDPVLAYPMTFTGSIGVFYGKVNLRGLYDKLGIRKQLLTRGRYADIDSDYSPLSEAARAKLREGVDDNYRVFVQKVAAARKRKFEEVEPLAQGRVWLGAQAKRNGLVDEMGGLDRAIELVRGKAKIPRGESVDLVVYPAQRSLVERLLNRSTEARTPAWLGAALKRWPVTAFSGSGYLRLAPYSLEVK